MANDKRNQCLVIGAGLGGLTTAALLIKAGMAVTVLEAQAYPGGCAGTFYYQGYQFDAGATLAGGFSEGGPHYRVAQALGIDWPIEPVAPVAWTVHLPDGRAVPQWCSAEKWRHERQHAFPGSERFWQRLDMLADHAWDVSSRPFPWPAQNGRELVELMTAIRPKTLRVTPHIFKTIANQMPQHDPMLRSFVDANLLISAQTTSASANALYGSAALDLPRRGVSHVMGGIGNLASSLAEWILAHGGRILYKQQVDKIELRQGRVVAVHTNLHKRHKASRLALSCDYLVANLTPWGLRSLLGEAAPKRLLRETAQRAPTWGAFMLYLAVHADKLPPTAGSHHQIVRDHRKPLGETNSLFISMSPAHDVRRAPAGMRVVNISTHTEVGQWWRLRQDPARRAEYEDRRAHYSEQLLAAAERALPGFKAAVALCLPATPVTYQQWTNRPMGMVGGFAQASILRARGPWTGLPNAWLVGDSVFPGQSTAGVTLSGMRVARTVLAAANLG